jgi:hypothetical protein
MIRTVEYQVRGCGFFPLDMLRYDASWPLDSDAIARMTEHQSELYTVRLRTALNRRPTEGRWLSFGWRVIEVNGKAH